MDEPTVWSFSGHDAYQSGFDVRVERRTIPAMNCESCGIWSIPTVHPRIELSRKMCSVLDSKFIGPIKRDSYQDMLQMLPRGGIKLYPGASLGPAKVIRIKGSLKDAFFWGVTPIVNEAKFWQLQHLMDGKLVGERIVNLDSDEKLFELVSVSIDLEKLYRERRCGVCGCLDTSRADREQICKIAKEAAIGDQLFTIPGGHWLVGSKFKSAVEKLGLRNAGFSAFVLEEYLNKELISTT